MAKKTVNLAEMVQTANRLLANFALCDEFKKGVCTMIEAALRSADAYAGYNYVYWSNEGCAAWEAAGRPDTGREQYWYGPTGQRYARHYYLEASRKLSAK